MTRQMRLQMRGLAEHFPTQGAGEGPPLLVNQHVSLEIPAVTEPLVANGTRQDLGSVVHGRQMGFRMGGLLERLVAQGAGMGPLLLMTFQVAF